METDPGRLVPLGVNVEVGLKMLVTVVAGVQGQTVNGFVIECLHQGIRSSTLQLDNYVRGAAAMVAQERKV